MHCNNRIEPSTYHQLLFGPPYIILYLVILVVGVILCGYGYAAVNADLLISGEATIMRSGGFTSEYLQDVTPAECRSAQPDDKVQLTDKRDGQKYWVMKMRDGNCWMVQNLALNLSTEGLTSELSDINPSTVAGYVETMNAVGEKVLSWNASSAFPPTATLANMAAVGSSRNTTRSWNYGKYVQKVYNQILNCGKNSKGPSGCGNQLQNVSGYEATWDFDHTKTTYDATSKQYDARFLIGNYYQQMAATAGSLQRATNATGTSSICQRGWQLPAKTNYRTLLTA